MEVARGESASARYFMSDSRLEERSVGKWVEHLSLKTVRQLAVAVIGSTVILFGIVLVLPGVPGPGSVVIGGGLAMLTTEFIWARVLMHKVRERVQSAVNTVKGKGPGAAKAAPSNDPKSDNISASG